MCLEPLKTFVLCQKKWFSSFFILRFLRGSKVFRGHFQFFLGKTIKTLFQGFVQSKTKTKRHP